MIRIDRLEKLAAHLEAGCPGGHEVFNFRSFNMSYTERAACGTAGCAAGECPIVWPKDWKFEGNSVYLAAGSCCTECDLRAWFGVSREQCSYLFMPRWCEDRSKYPKLCGMAKLPENATRSEVAANIRAFLDWAKREVPA